MTYWTYFRSLCGLPLVISAVLLFVRSYTDIDFVGDLTAFLSWLYLIIYVPIFLFLWFLFKTSSESSVLKNIWYYPAPYLMVLGYFAYMFQGAIDAIQSLLIAAIIYYVYIAFGIGVYTLANNQGEK